MESLLQNIRVGARSLRTPAFAVTAVLTLALGIGLGTAVFTAADAFPLRPLPVRDQNRVVVLWGATRDGRFDNFPLLLPDARDLVVDALSAYHAARVAPASAQGTVTALP
jgi:putative ABC transport system permease protein